MWLLLHPDLSAAAAAVAAAAKAKLVTAPGEGSRRLSAAALGARRRSSVLQLRKSSVSAVAAAAAEALERAAEKAEAAEGLALEVHRAATRRNSTSAAAK